MERSEAYSPRSVKSFSNFFSDGISWVTNSPFQYRLKMCIRDRYLGHMVELAKSNELYRKPLHPYTQTLLSAIPIADPKASRAKQRIILQGDIPSPMNPPSGCTFRTRCPYATEECAQSAPEFKEWEPGHFAACHHLDKIN